MRPGVNKMIHFIMTHIIYAIPTVCCLMEKNGGIEKDDEAHTHTFGIRCRALRFRSIRFIILGYSSFGEKRQHRQTRAAK